MNTSSLVLAAAVVLVVSMGGAYVLAPVHIPESSSPPARQPNAIQEVLSVRLETGIDRGASALDVKVIPHEVVEDSRCPRDALCIQLGTVRLRATLESGLGTADQIFSLGEPITTEAEVVTLVSVLPEPSATRAIEASEYRFFFTIEKRSSPAVSF